MDKNQALEVITQAVDIAVRKGAYCLEDTKAINKALEVLKTPDLPEIKPKEE